MTDTSELVKRLRKWLPVLVLQEVAQAIERFEGEKIELERRATFIEHEHPQKLEPHFSEAMGLLTTRKAFRKSEIAQLLAEQMQQLADARAREEHVKNFIAGRLHTLSRRSKKPLEYTSLNRILGLLSEALATPVPMDELQRLGQEYDNDPAPSKGEGSEGRE